MRKPNREVVRDLDRMQASNAGLLVCPTQLMASASKLMARSKRRRFTRADLEIGRREIEAASALVDFAALHLRGLREFVQARNALKAVFRDQLDVVEGYAENRLRLPHLFPEDKLRVRGEEWRFSIAVAVALLERRWINPPNCTHISRYIRNRAWQILWDRKIEDEQEHIDARKQVNRIVLQNVGYDELRGMVPARVATIDFRIDFANTMNAINAGAQFRNTMAAMLFGDERWADLSIDPNFSTRFRRENAATLRHFCARMAAYLEPPLRRLFEHQIAAKALNRAAALVNLSAPKKERH